MGSGHIRNVSVIVALKTCISFCDTDSDTVSSITHAQANYPVQKSLDSISKNSHLTEFYEKGILSFLTSDFALSVLIS